MLQNVVILGQVFFFFFVDHVTAFNAILQYRSPRHIRGFELDGWTWAAGFALHCSIHTW